MKTNKPTLVEKKVSCDDGYYDYEEWRVNGELHREDGPAITKILYRDHLEDDAGTIVEEKWYLNGELHREDGPAFFEINEWEDWGRHYEKRIEYWVNGKKHRKNGPAVIEIDENNQIVHEAWMLNGKFNRNGGPALIDKSENYILETWYKNDNRHRNNAPAFVKKAKDGTVIMEKWFKNGEQYRKDGPFFIKKNNKGTIVTQEEWNENLRSEQDLPCVIRRDERTGHIIEEIWLLNGKYHRLNGKPAWILNDGDLKDKQLWEHGKFLGKYKEPEEPQEPRDIIGDDLQCLVGKKITEIYMTEDFLTFITDQGPFFFECEGECCSTSYFYDFIGVKKLLNNGPVISVSQIPMDGWGDEDIGWFTDVYGYEIVTESEKFGEMTSVFSFRNQNNGYYGGYIVRRLKSTGIEKYKKNKLTDDCLEIL